MKTKNVTPQACTPRATVTECLTYTVRVLLGEASFVLGLGTSYMAFPMQSELMPYLHLAKACAGEGVVGGVVLCEESAEAWPDFKGSCHGFPATSTKQQVGGPVCPLQSEGEEPTGVQMGTRTGLGPSCLVLPKTDTED